MAELRRDPITGRWVIISTEKGDHGEEFEVERHEVKAGFCPFCYGNEDKTPPEVDAFRPDSSPPNTPGWLTRTVPNKFPALQIHGGLGRVGMGIYDMMNGIGAHEVIIETPDHKRTIADLSTEETERVIRAYRARCIDLNRDKRFRYILIFKNYGFSAGASLEHPHSQLIALPIVPKRVQEELQGTEFYYQYKERCVYCDIISQELGERSRLVAENEEFLSFCPYASRFPFETWILGKCHSSAFSQITEKQIANLALILKETMSKIKTLLGDPSYNYIIHTAPAKDKEREDYHWHIEIMPKLIHTAGFEWGSGFYTNPTPPEEAARRLNEVKI